MRLGLAGTSKNVPLQLLKSVNVFLRWLVSFTHHLQMRIEWELPPQPEWFDHYIDLYYQWHDLRNPLWLERGCFSLLALHHQARVLELCCGDGFNVYHFYSAKASEVVAVDFDSQVIQHAKNRNWAPNIRYEVCDIRSSMPEGVFDNIVWDAALEHFTPEEMTPIMRNIKERLQPGGVLSGYTLVAKPGQGKQLSHHEYEFKSKEELLGFLAPHFRNVRVFETIYPSRHNLYFFASDGVLPFDQAWKSQVVSVRT